MKNTFHLFVCGLSCLWLSSLASGQDALEKPATQTDDQAAHVSEQPASDDAKSDAGDFESQLELFLRIRRDRKRDPIAMETSITRYITKNDKGQPVSVDLIGVVHIGEKEYYESLNKRFEQYDSLLYELVAPEGTVIPKGGRDTGWVNPIAALQKGMQSMLGLEFQLDHIDYTVDNFVHADMTPDEFLESMKENDESFIKMAFRAIGQSMAMQSSGNMSDFDLMMAMLSNDREKKLRSILAEQMQDLESGMVIFQGRDGSTIINHRNRKALEIMRQQIEAGNTKLAVFYGAGHLPDMDQRLIKEHGMRRGGQFWLTAWKLK